MTGQEYVRRGDWLSWEHELTTETVVTISGKDPYRDKRYGVSAVIGIERNGTPLVWDRLHVEKSEDRAKLAKRAHAPR